MPPDFPVIRYETAHVAAANAADVAASDFDWGGEIRQRYEYTRNPGFGAEPQDENGVWLQRWAVYGDLHWGKHLRVFGELHSALASGRASGPGPTDQNELEFQNAFVEWRIPLSSAPELLVRAGRQELQFGSARIVSVRDGPNVRRTFDGIRVVARSSDWQFSVFAMRPRKDDPYVFDDSSDATRKFRGLYATRVSGNTGVDLYYAGYENEAAVFDQGRAREHRHTLGLRFFGNSNGWSWNWEPMLQFGSFGAADLRAWTLATETAYTWSQVRLQPRLALSVNIASGDRDPRHADLQTFNPLFPRGNYFSEDALLGPQNFYNVHGFLTIHPATSWSLTADYNLFWRLSTHDGVHGPGGALLRSGSGSGARFVATALSLAAQWTPDRHWSLSAIYTRSSPRQFIDETGPSLPVDFLELTARFRF